MTVSSNLRLIMFVACSMAKRTFSIAMSLIFFTLMRTPATFSILCCIEKWSLSSFSLLNTTTESAPWPEISGSSGFSPSGYPSAICWPVSPPSTFGRAFSDYDSMSMFSALISERWIDLISGLYVPIRLSLSLLCCESEEPVLTERISDIRLLTLAFGF